MIQKGHENFSVQYTREKDTIRKLIQITDKAQFEKG